MRRRSGARPDPCRILVTGGSGAIGGAICRQLAASGNSVIVHAGQHPARAEAVVEQIRQQGGQAQAISVELADAAACAEAMAGLLAEAPLAGIVHNAGIHDDAPMAGMPATQWERVIDINLNAFYRIVQPALLGMARQRWGRIIAVSSVSARLGNRGQANYAAAKAGLHGAVFALSREMAGRGVTANVVAPGLIASPMLETQDDPAMLSMIPAGRIGQPEDVATLVDFLCSDGAAYISAQVIGVDGGMAPG